MPRPAYRCDDCFETAARCAVCRERRADAVRVARARKRAAGLCIECGAPALAGMSRCEAHRVANNTRSADAHREARRTRAS